MIRAMKFYLVSLFASLSLMNLAIASNLGPVTDQLVNCALEQLEEIQFKDLSRSDYIDLKTGEYHQTVVDRVRRDLTEIYNSALAPKGQAKFGGSCRRTYVRGQLMIQFKAQDGPNILNNIGKGTFDLKNSTGIPFVDDLARELQGQTLKYLSNFDDGPLYLFTFERKELSHLFLIEKLKTTYPLESISLNGVGYLAVHPGEDLRMSLSLSHKKELIYDLFYYKDAPYQSGEVDIRQQRYFYSNLGTSEAFETLAGNDFQTFQHPNPDLGFTSPSASQTLSLQKAPKGPGAEFDKLSSLASCLKPASQYKNSKDYEFSQELSYTLLTEALTADGQVEFLKSLDCSGTQAKTPGSAWTEFEVLTARWPMARLSFFWIDSQGVEQSQSRWIVSKPDSPEYETLIYMMTNITKGIISGSPDLSKYWK